MKINKTNITFSKQNQTNTICTTKEGEFYVQARVPPSFCITLITWQNTACVHKNVDVKFSTNDAFLE